MDIFNRKGELRHIHKLRFWALGDVLHEKYRLPKETAVEIASFILPMIDLNPENRATAQVCLQHSWLSDVDLKEIANGETGGWALDTDDFTEAELAAARS